MQNKTQSDQHTADKLLRKTGGVESALGKMGATAGGAVDKAWTAPGRAINSAKAQVKHVRLRVSRKARDAAKDLAIRWDPDRPLPVTAGDDEKDTSSP